MPRLANRLSAISVPLSISMAMSLGAAEIQLDELDLTGMSSGWGVPKARQSIVGKGMVINGKSYARGVGTHVESVLILESDGGVEAFDAAFPYEETPDQLSAIAAVEKDLAVAE